MATITLFRSGGLTPLEEIRNLSSAEFDEVTKKHTGVSLNRSSSVYAAFNLDETETFWEDYRANSNQLDSTIYRIDIPEELHDEEIYAYNLEPYDQYWFSKGNKWDNPTPESFTKDYISTRVHISDWENTLFCLPMEELRYYEILIPHHIATKCDWEILTNFDREEWFGEWYQQDAELAFA